MDKYLLDQVVRKHLALIKHDIDEGIIIETETGLKTTTPEMLGLNQEEIFDGLEDVLSEIKNLK